MFRSKNSFINGFVNYNAHKKKKKTDFSINFIIHHIVFNAHLLEKINYGFEII